MATQANGHSKLPDPKFVGNGFVQQYYHILYNSPQLGHKFYQDASEILWSGPDGQMTSVATMQGIHDKILSLDLDKFKFAIASVDAQASFKDGILVLVTGYLTKENVRRTFSQTFFLAPHEKGYYVLSDIFRYVNDEGSVPLSPTVGTDDDDDEVVDEPVTPDTEPESSIEPDKNDVPPEEVVHNVTDDVAVPNPNGSEVVVVPNGTEVVDNKPMENGIDSAAAEIEAVANSVAKDVAPAAVVISSSSIPREDAPKMSFASVVSALKNNSSQSWQVRSTPAKAVEKPRAPTLTNGTPVVEKSSSAQQAKRYSVFVGGLPLEATVEQVEAAFESFGPVKRNGIQVKCSKGSCFAFVEFESESSMRSALEAGSVAFGTRNAHIEEQKNDDRGRFSQGRGGYRGGGEESFRGRGSFSGGRDYGRSDFERKFDTAPRGPRNGGAYSRDFQNGAGQGLRQLVKETTTTGVKKL